MSTADRVLENTGNSGYSLSDRDTEWVKDQLNVMEEAEISYSDGRTSQWTDELQEKYEELVNAFGGEDVEQYVTVGKKGINVSVEAYGEKVFNLRAEEERYEGYSNSGSLAALF